MGDDHSLITVAQKTYFEIVLVFIGFTIICGNVFVLVTMYRLVLIFHIFRKFPFFSVKKSFIFRSYYFFKNKYAALILKN